MDDEEWDGDESDPEYQRLLQQERAKAARKPAATLVVSGLVVLLIAWWASAQALEQYGRVGPLGGAVALVGVALIVWGLWRMARRWDSR